MPDSTDVIVPAGVLPIRKERLIESTHQSVRTFVSKYQTSIRTEVETIRTAVFSVYCGDAVCRADRIGIITAFSTEP